MAPRPRPSPDDSLFAEEKPYLQGRRRSSGLMLSGLENDLSIIERHDSWDDELGGGSSIELTCSSSGGSSSSSSGGLHPSAECDPLVLSSTTTTLCSQPNTKNHQDHHYENSDCANDAEIAALMAAEWNAEVRRELKESAAAKKQQIKQPQRLEPLNSQQTCLVYVWLTLVVIGIVGLGIYSVLFGLGDSNNQTDGAVALTGSYQCPTSDHPLDLPSLEQLTHEQATGNNTSVCRHDDSLKDCSCQNPTSSSHFLLGSFSANKKSFDQKLAKETAKLVEGEGHLDVVFVGQFSSNSLGEEDDSSIWSSHQIQKAHIAAEEDIRSSTILYRFETEGIIPSEVKPKVWWISLGEQDLLVDGCSLDAVHMGTYHLVQSILGRSSSDMNVKIIISPPPPPPQSQSNNETNENDAVLQLLNDWNERIKCIANVNSQVDYYNPYKTGVEQQQEDEDDDDFFVNVGGGGGHSSSTTSTTTTTTTPASPEEVQQAIVDKLVELLH